MDSGWMSKNEIRRAENLQPVSLKINSLTGGLFYVTDERIADAISLPGSLITESPSDCVGPRFKVGDRVRVIANHDAYNGKEGAIRYRAANGVDPWAWAVRLDSGALYAFAERELESVDLMPADETLIPSPVPEPDLSKKINFREFT